MFRLPKNTPPFFETALASVSAGASAEQAIAAVAAPSMRSLGALDYVVSCSIENIGTAAEPLKLLFAGTDRPAAPADFSNRFCRIWEETNIDRQINRELERKLSSVSYSAFSWPYPIKHPAAEEQSPFFNLPKSYSLFIPFSSGLIVTLEHEVSFSGYLALLFDEFPELRDERVQLIISLPVLFSEMVSSYYRQSAKRSAEWLSGYAHDVKHHLLMTLELLRTAGGDDAERRARALGKLDRLSRRLLLVTSSRLLADRDSGGALRINPLKLKVNELIEEVCAEIGPLYKAAGVPLNKQLSPDLPEVSIDPAVFPSVIFNLLDNALKYSPERGDVTIRSFATEGAVALEVSDSGIGVPDEERESIFERHHRANNASAFPGDGLGLYLARRIVGAHSGSIICKPNEPNGTLFRVELPASA